MTPDEQGEKCEQWSVFASVRFGSLNHLLKYVLIILCLQALFINISIFCYSDSLDTMMLESLTLSRDCAVLFWKSISSDNICLTLFPDLGVSVSVVLASFGPFQCASFHPNPFGWSHSIPKFSFFFSVAFHFIISPIQSDCYTFFSVFKDCAVFCFEKYFFW